MTDRDRSPDPAREQVLLDLALLAHRSLDRKGFFALMAFLGGAMLGTGIVFLALGAWPVFAFCGLEFVLLLALFRLNYRGLHEKETLRLVPSELCVRRFSRRGETGCWRFQPFRLRVELDERPGRHGRILIRSHGRPFVIGAFLPPEERVEIVGMLNAALEACRLPPHRRRRKPGTALPSAP